MNYTLKLTGNELRFIFYAIKNKNSDAARKVQNKILSIALQENKNLMKKTQKNATS